MRKLICATGLVLLTGVGGLTSFGQAAFVGVGAYTTAYVTTAEGLPAWAAMFGNSGGGRMRGCIGICRSCWSWSMCGSNAPAAGTVTGCSAARGASGYRARSNASNTGTSAETSSNNSDCSGFYARAPQINRSK